MAEISTDLVLIVDDNPDVRELLRLRLELEGLKVATAANGQEALELARSLEPSIVILDLKMPIMDGWQALPLLRETDPAMRIIVHSGSANLQGQYSGVTRPDAVVSKGKSLQTMLETIGELRRESPDDRHPIDLPPIPLEQPINAFDTWLGLQARIRECRGDEADCPQVPGLEALSRVFFELGLLLLRAAQQRAAEVALSMQVRRATAEAALRALESIRSGGFDAFYSAWGYVPVPEAEAALRELSDHLTDSLLTSTVRSDAR